MVFETIPNLLINDQDLQDILENIVQYTKESLEAIGAEVILVDQKYLTDTQKPHLSELIFYKIFQQSLQSRISKANVYQAC